jgi:hypothetical protein
MLWFSSRKHRRGEAMPTQVSLVTELSRERLIELRDEIDALLGLPPAETSGQHQQPTSSAGAVDPLAIKLRDRLSPNLKRLVAHIAANHGSGEFNWDDVATGMGEKVGTVKSWHRSLSKPMNRLARETPAAPHLLADRWDGSRQVYVLNSAWKEAIERTW